MWHKIKHPANSTICTVIVSVIFIWLYATVRRIFRQFGASEAGSSAVRRAAKGRKPKARRQRNLFRTARIHVGVLTHARHCARPGGW